MGSFSGFTARTSGSARVLACAAGVAAVAGIGVVALTGPATPAVQAAPDPCTASEVAKTAGSVATDTGEYLDSHPQTNRSLTLIAQQQGGPQSLAALKSYFDANPLVAADMQRLQQPLTALAGRCKLPVTLPQLLGLMQAAQPQQSPVSAALPAERAPAVSQGAAAVPGPAASPR